MKHFIIFLALILLGSCHRSPEPLFYVLQPLPAPLHHAKGLTKIIGIEEVSIPAYVAKPGIVVHYAPNQVFVNEQRLWAEDLSKNITRLIQTNLTLLEPGAIVQRSPWPIIFLRPKIRVQVSILRFILDTLGRASLMAEYYIYDEDKVIKKAQVAFTKEANPKCFDCLIFAMNENLTGLSLTIVKDLKF